MYSLVYFDYLDNVFKNKYLDYDVKTVTAGDYTFEFNISVQQYEHFEQNYLKKDNPMSEMAQMRQYVQHEIEKRLNQLGPEG